ncbi:MAG: hypothetical protein K0B14_17235 [Anaerolineaceae bacterium]|nr:hypothetical protein [Anaerolineaceae bacterium]
MNKKLRKTINTIIILCFSLSFSVTSAKTETAEINPDFEKSSAQQNKVLEFIFKSIKR